MKKKTTKALAARKEKPLTPRDRARLVFSSRDSEAAVAALAYYVEKLGYSGDTIRRELPAFILYWTEPTPNGKRQRWQLQKTFDVTRRLITWLRRAESYKSTNKRIGGASITI